MVFVIPIQIALTWPVPNYVNPITRGPLEMWLLSAIFLSGATVCVTFRLWSRVYVRRWFGLDDLFILMGFGFAVAVTALVGVGTTHYNWDRHIWDMKPSNYEPSLKILYFTRIFWGLASSCIRLSVICLYYRLLKACEAPRKFFLIMHITTVFNIGILFYYIFTGVLPCNPIRAYWSYPIMSDAYCIDDAKSIQVAGIVNTFAEFLLAILPLTAVYLLKVRKSQRWGIISLLSLGFLVTLVGCFRTYYIWRVWTTFDLTWYSAPQWICSEVENYLALMCACAVPLRPLVGRTVRQFERKPLKTTSQVSRASSGSLNANHSRTEIATDDAADWASMMRKIDLEGIGDDGYGYTISISGPAAPEKPRAMAWIRAVTSNLLRFRGNRENSNVESQRMEMIMKTEVTVDETIRPMEKRSRWNSITTDSSDVITAIVETDTSVSKHPTIVTSSIDGPKSHMPETHFPYGNDSSEGVQALPAMPNPTYKAE